MMSNPSASTEPFSSSNWEVYQDTFAPQPAVQKPKAWERAPVSAHAPRLQGQKIWKRATRRSRRKNSGEFEEDAQLELQKGGVGARKRSRVMGAKENINNAPWLEAQNDSENIVTTACIGEEHVPNPESIFGVHDVPRFVPRKRTNFDHVITPRKTLRQTTLNAQAWSLSPQKSPRKTVERSPRKHKSMRQSTRRLTRLELAEFEVPAEQRFSDIILTDTPASNSLNLEREEGTLAESVASHAIDLPAMKEDPAESSRLASITLSNILPVTPPAANSEDRDRKDTEDVAKEMPEAPERKTRPLNSEIIAEMTQSSTMPESHDDDQTAVVMTKSTRRRRTLDEIILEEEQTIQPPATPRSTRKMTSGTPVYSLASATKETLKPGRKTPRRSTRNTRASSVDVEASALAPESIAAATASESSSADVNNMAEELPKSASEESIAEKISTTDMSSVSETEQLPLNAAVEQIEAPSVEVKVDHRASEPTEDPALNEDTEPTARLDNKSVRVEERPTIAAQDNSEQEVNGAEVAEDSQKSTEEVELAIPQSPSTEVLAFEFVGSPCSDIPSESSLVNFSPEFSRALQFEMSKTVEGLNSVSEEVAVAEEQVIESIESADEIVETSMPSPKITDLTAPISAKAPLAAYDEDDTDMLRNFLTRVKANKAAKAEKSPKRKRSLPHSPLRIPLGTAEANSSPPPPEAGDGVEPEKSSSPLAKRRKGEDIVAEDEDVAEPKSIRRSGRTRLPVKSQPPGAPSFIPVRRMGQEGDTTVTLKRSEEKELAALTRVNTRKNKGAAISASVFLAQKSNDKEDTVLRQRSLKEAFEEKPSKKKAKTVVWAEELAQYQKSEQELLNEKQKAVAEKKSASVKVGVRSKIALGMAANGTPAPKRKMKVRGGK